VVAPWSAVTAASSCPALGCFSVELVNLSNAACKVYMAVETQRLEPLVLPAKHLTVSEDSLLQLGEEPLWFTVIFVPRRRGTARSLTRVAG
jgi:hypothetical protein